MHAFIREIPVSQLKLGSLGIVALLAAALTMYGVLPQWRAYQQARDSLVTLDASTASGLDLDAQLSAMGEEINGLERTLHGDTSDLPIKQVEAFVIGRLQTISWRNRVELIGVQPREGAEVGEFRELIFDVDLRGNYFDLFSWLKTVSAELGFIVIKRFEMSPISISAGDEPELLLQLTMASYRKAET